MQNAVKTILFCVVVGASVVGLPMRRRDRASLGAGFQEDTTAADPAGAVGGMAGTGC